MNNIIEGRYLVCRSLVHRGLETGRVNDKQMFE